MEFGNVSSASEDLKSAFRKSPLLLAGFAVLSALALFGLVSLVLFGLTMVPGFLMEDETAIELSSEEEESAEIPIVNAVYGTITEMRGDALTLSVETGDSSVVLYFEMAADTEYTSFSYANDDDLVGQESPSRRSDLSIGDTVTIYTDEEIASMSPQKAVRIVELAQ